MLHLLSCKVSEQYLIALDLKSALLHIIDLKLLTVVDRIVRVTDQLKSHVVSVAKTAGALSRDVVIGILDDLVAQEREGYVI